MSRESEQRLNDVAAACRAIEGHLRSDADAGIVFDAIRLRLVEIGEAVKDLDGTVLATEPEIPWSDLVRMRDLLVHRYFDANHSLVLATATRDVPVLLEATCRLLARFAPTRR